MREKFQTGVKACREIGKWMWMPKNPTPIKPNVSFAEISHPNYMIATSFTCLEHTKTQFCLPQRQTNPDHRQIFHKISINKHTKYHWKQPLHFVNNQCNPPKEFGINLKTHNSLIWLRYSSTMEQKVLAKTWVNLLVDYVRLFLFICLRNFCSVKRWNKYD